MVLRLLGALERWGPPPTPRNSSDRLYGAAGGPSSGWQHGGVTAGHHSWGCRRPLAGKVGLLGPSLLLGQVVRRQEAGPGLSHVTNVRPWTSTVSRSPAADRGLQDRGGSRAAFPAPSPAPAYNQPIMGLLEAAGGDTITLPPTGARHSTLCVAHQTLFMVSGGGMGAPQECPTLAPPLLGLVGSLHVTMSFCA